MDSKKQQTKPQIDGDTVVYAAFALFVFLIVILVAMGIRGQHLTNKEYKLLCMEKGLVYDFRYQGCVRTEVRVPQETGETE